MGYYASFGPLGTIVLWYVVWVKNWEQWCSTLGLKKLAGPLETRTYHTWVIVPYLVILG